MTRRDLIKATAAAMAGGAMPVLGQQSLRGWPWARKGFLTTHTSSFHPTIIKTGATLLWQWPDGTYTANNSPTKTLAAGTKTVFVRSRDGFGLMTSFKLINFGLLGTLPSFEDCPLLVTLYVNTSGLTGNLPSFARCTVLDALRIHQSSFSGVVPSFATCTAMTEIIANQNSFSAFVAGSFATQKFLASLNFGTNALPAAEINKILADCVASLSISGRVACVVGLSSGTNAAPTGQGLVDKATLIAAGWTVTTN